MFRQVIAKFHGELALYIGRVIVFIIAFAKFLQNTHVVTSPYTIVEYYNKVIQQVRKEQHSFWIYLFFAIVQSMKCFKRVPCIWNFKVPHYHAMKFDISFLIKKISI